MEGRVGTNSTRLAAHDGGEWSRTNEVLEDGKLNWHRIEDMGREKFGPIYGTIESNTRDIAAGVKHMILYIV